MLSHSLWWLTVDGLAVYRASVLVTKDKITDSAREYIRSRGWVPAAIMGEPREVDGIGPWLARWTFEIVICPWCISIWLAAGVVALTRLTPGAWQYGAMFLALSGVAGYLAER